MDADNSPYEILFRSFISRFCIICIGILFIPTLYAAENTWVVPRTSNGTPDLEGIWGNHTQTPLQRPKSLGDKRSYTDSEAKELIDKVLMRNQERAKAIDPDRGAPEVGARIGTAADNNFVTELLSKVAYIDGEYRTSLIIEPADGRISYIEGATDVRQKWSAEGYGAYDGPEMREPGERCFSYPAQLPIIMPLAGIHSRLLQIMQTDNYVVIFGEYNIGFRIIRLNSEHRENEFEKWLGDSIGHWEDDTLVVHTTNFRPQQSNMFIRSSANLQVTERFIPISQDELLYRFTFDDPTIYQQPFTAEIPLDRLPKDEKIYEQNRHEGNYSLPGILAGARRLEIDAGQ